MFKQLDQTDGSKSSFDKFSILKLVLCIHLFSSVDQLSENGKGGHDSSAASGEEEEEDEPSETVQCPLMSRLTLIAVGNTDKADLK